MGRIYSAGTSNISLKQSDQHNWIIENFNNTNVFRLCGFSLVLDDPDAVGDANEEFVTVSILRWLAGTTVTFGGIVSARPHHTGDPADHETVRAGTTFDPNGTSQVLASYSWNLRYPFSLYWDNPNERPTFSPDEVCTIDVSAASAAHTMTQTITFEELGG